MTPFRSAVAVCLLAVCAWAEPGKSAEPAIWKYSKPDAKALIGINFRRVMSQLPAEQTKAIMQDPSLAALGLGDLASSVEQVLISSSVDRLTEKAGQDPPVLVVLKGKFELAKLREAAVRQRANIRLYKFVEFIYPEKAREQDMHIALVNNDTVLVGDRKSLLEAVDRNSIEQAQRASNALYQRAAEMSAYNDVWMVMKIPAEALAADASPQAAMLKDVDAVEIGASFGDPFRLQVNLGTSTEDAARTLATGIGMFVGMANSSKNDPSTAAFLKNLKVTTGPNAVRIAMAMDRKDFKTRMGSVANGISMNDLNLKGVLRSNMPFTVGPVGQPKPIAAAAAPAPVAPPEPAEDDSKPKVIKIYGLDEGTREIPLAPKKPTP